MRILQRLIAFLIVASPVFIGKFNPNFAFSMIELTFIWIAVLAFLHTPDELKIFTKELSKIIFEVILKIKSVKNGDFGIDFNAEEKIQSAETKIQNIEDEQEKDSNLENYSQEIFENINEKIGNPFAALSEAKKHVVDNIRDIITEIAPDAKNPPAFSERTILKILGKYNSQDISIINKKISDLINDLSLISKFEISQKSFESNNLLYLTELYSRLACILYGEKIRLRSQAGIPSEKPEKPTSPKGIVPAAISFAENILYASISIIDANGRLFPIRENLDHNNFTIREIRNSIKSPPLPIVSVVPTLKARTPIYIIFVIDNSLSMNSEVKGYSIPKIEMAKNALSYFVDQFGSSFKNRDDTSLALLMFGDSNCNFFNFDGSIWSSDLPLVRNGIQTLQLSDKGTPLWDTLFVAINTIKEEQGQKLIICLTDGENNKGDTDFTSLQNLAQNSAIPIYNISYGGGTQEHDMLKILSESSGAGSPGIGSFIDQNCGNLPNIFKDIGDTIAYSYVISWISNNAELIQNEKVDIIVDVAYDSYKLSFNGSYYYR